MPKKKPLKWALPEVVHPVGTRCYKVHVPDDRAYIGAFLGAMFLLTKPYAWADDPSHTAIEVGAVWRGIFDSLIAGNCDRIENPPQAGVDEGENLIRQNPDNPCILETSINGTDWCQFADLSLCVPQGSQPGTGQDQPPAGGCAQYQGSMNGNALWLLPTNVTTGDTIEVTGASGVTYDGGNLDWHCPGGDVFFAGFCTGVTFVHALNPLPSIPEMKLIASIGGVFYDVYNGVFTVPGGISNQPVTFQVNHSDITGDGGQLQFTVKVCNNQSANWTHTFNFLANDGGFTNIAYPAGQDTAAWTSAVGWEAVDCVNLSGPAVYTILAIQKALAATTITNFDMTYDATLGANPAGDQTRVNLRSGGTDHFVIAEAPRAGTNLTDSWVGNVSGVTAIQIYPIFAFADGGGTCDSSPAITLKSITISGTGIDPF